MKVKDLLPMEIDIDVYDDVCEDLGIAFCGPLKLTEEGMERFGEALEYEITINPSSYGGLPAVIVHVDDDNSKVWRRRLNTVKGLFEAAAGYCAADDYDRWFKDE